MKGVIKMNPSAVKKYLVIAVILLFIGTIIIPSSGQKIEKLSFPTSRGNTLYVGGSGPGNYSSIQAAIDAASDGDTVFVYDDSSPYHEKVKINKAIRLVGENQQTTVIDGRDFHIPLSTTVSLTADDVTFTGFTVRNGGFFIGIGLNVNSTHSTIIGNTFIGNISPPLLIFDIILANSNNNIIKENTVSLGTVGIYLSVSNDTTITGNNITKNSGYGIELYNSRRNIISKNNIMKNGKDVFFTRDLGIFPLSNHWYANYWGKHYFLLKRIPGEMYLLKNESENFTLHLVNFDWHPAQKPYDIPGMS
jgi:parallel beta-helix repeat protein